MKWVDLTRKTLGSFTLMSKVARKYFMYGSPRNYPLHDYLLIVDILKGEY